MKTVKGAVDDFIEAFAKRTAKVEFTKQSDRIRHKSSLVRSLVAFAIILAGLSIIDLFQKDVILVENGIPREAKSFSSNVEGLLLEKGVELAQGDKVEPPLTSSLKDGMVINVVRAFDIEIISQEESKLVRSTPVTVADLIKVAQLELGYLDKVEPSMDTVITEPQTVKIVRVTQKTLTEDQKVPFRVENKQEPTLEKGLKKILVRGREGIGRNHIQVTYEDGVEAKREIVSQEIVKEPVTQVIAMGTIDTISRGGVQLRFKEAKEVRTTAYTHTGRRTASGVWPEVGLIAADPKVIPLGTRVYVEGYGYARIADTGSAIKGDKVDLFMETKEECRRWGVRHKKLYILD